MSLLIAPVLRSTIDSAAALYALPTWFYSIGGQTEMFRSAVWLEGMCLVESSYNLRATRYESHLDRPGRKDQPSDGDTPGQDNFLREDDTSYGLLQIMGFNIKAALGLRSLPVPMDFSFAFDPLVNLYLGCWVLRGELRAVGGDVTRALARYNGGPTGDDPDPNNGGDIRLRAYVNKVAKASLQVRDDRLQKGWATL